MNLVGLNVGLSDSLSAKTRRYADYYRQISAGTIREVVDDETVELAPCFYRSIVEKVAFTRCKKIKSFAFAYCENLYAVDFPELIHIDVSAFERTSNLHNIFFQNVETLNSNAFRYSGIEDATFPSCLGLGSAAFGSCKSLKEIKIPKCKSLSTYAFSGCSALEKIFLDGVTDVPQLGSFGLNSTPDTVKIIVPDALVDSFKVDTNWSTYANRIIGVSEYEATQAP